MLSSVFSPLLRWYKRNGRDLPWRRTRDPYRILVSEIMLQQTQVERVKTFYAAWLKTFPDWQRLAQASNAEVIHAWSGLGYNRRALALRDIARVIVEQGVPRDEAGWLGLKGIGPYTAAAVAAFALHIRTMPVDTNIRRVLARALLGRPYPTPKTDDQLKRRAVLELKNIRAFFDVPQAIFDLATLVCKKVPDCAVCPMRQTCQAAPKFLNGKVRVPKAMIRRTNERRHRDKPHPDRIYRGRILAAVRKAPSPGLRFEPIAHAADPAYESRLDRDWMLAMLARLERDQMLVKQGIHWKLA